MRSFANFSKSFFSSPDSVTKMALASLPLPSMLLIVPKPKVLCSTRIPTRMSSGRSGLKSALGVWRTGAAGLGGVVGLDVTAGCAAPEGRPGIAGRDVPD